MKPFLAFVNLGYFWQFHGRVECSATWERGAEITNGAVGTFTVNCSSTNGDKRPLIQGPTSMLNSASHANSKVFNPMFYEIFF